MSKRTRNKNQFKQVPHEILKAVVYELVAGFIVENLPLNFCAGFLSGLRWISSVEIEFERCGENTNNTKTVKQINLQWPKGLSADIAIANALGFVDATPATIENMEFAQGFYHSTDKALEEIGRALFKVVLPVAN